MTIHWFFTFGTNPRPATYHPADDPTHQAKSCFATTALLELGWPVPAEKRSAVELHLFGTPEIADVEPGKPREIFQRELARVAPELTLPASPTCSFDKRDPEAIWQVVREVLDRVHDDDEVVLELTNGIRSITTGFLLASGLLLAHRKRVRVRGVPYAELGASELAPSSPGASAEKGSPVIDLLPFLRLFEWSHAVRAMSRYLDPTPTLDLLRQSGAGLPGDAERRLGELGAALALNFPVEIERSLAAWRAIEVPAKLSPAADLALRHVGGELGPLAPAGRAPDATPPLDEDRLAFDLALLERLVAAERYADAARAVREWIVNAVLLAWGEGEAWLKPALRGRAEAALFGVSDKGPGRDLRLLWDEACAHRNAVSHLRYNEKHAVDAAGLRAFLTGAVARLEALRDASPALFRLEREPTKRYVASAFSANMLARSSISAKFTEIKRKRAREELDGRTSIVGHASTATLLSRELGADVAYNRADVTLDRGDTVLLGQYTGPRLPEGTTELPDGAKVTWILVELY